MYYPDWTAAPPPPGGTVDRSGLDTSSREAGRVEQLVSLAQIWCGVQRSKMYILETKC